MLGAVAHTKNDPNTGLLEGIARGASQACVYVLEFQKTQLQVHGYIPRYTHTEWFHHLSRGLLSSTLSSGIVYGAYFSLYNQFPDRAFAGAVATLGTSILKIPIANSMRVLQTGNHPHVFSAGKSIIKAQGIRGLYNGYLLSIPDDYIDMEIRIRVYNFLRDLVPAQHMSPQMGLVLGAISGSMAAALTTPFDTIRCHMAVSSTQKCNTTILCTARKMLCEGGIPMFVRGIGFRASSNALRTSLFCLFYEILLQSKNKEKEKETVMI